MSEKSENNNISGFDQLSAKDMLDLLYHEQKQAVLAIEPALAKLAEAVNIAAKHIGDNGRLVYVGAGTSGRLAVQDGVELGPTYGWSDRRTIYLMAGGRRAMLQSVEGAEDNAQDGKSVIINNNISKNDIVICVAASGTTPFTLGALRAAKQLGALCISFVSCKDTPILNEADFGILANTGAEIPSGSTRMKAGTAQKIMLNMFSTALMSRLGYIYDGLMVDMVCSNAKLRRRAVDIVCQISGCTSGKAEQILAQTNYHIKTSILMAMGLSADEARKTLAQNENNLRSAIDELRRQSSI